MTDFRSFRLESMYAHPTRPMTLSAANVLRGIVWSAIGACYAGALTGCVYGTVMYPISGTIVGTFLGAASAIGATLFIGPFVSITALLSESPMERLRQTTIVGALGNIVLFFIVLKFTRETNWLFVMSIFPTTAGAAWTGAFVSRKTVDEITAMKKMPSIVTTKHVIVVSTLTGLIFWVQPLAEITLYIPLAIPYLFR